MIKKCEMCGKKFVVENKKATRTKYCSAECRRRKINENAKKYRNATVVKEKPNSMAELKRIARECVKLHMSYGEYVVKMG